MAETTDIREWARQQGIDIGDRGRIPGDVRARFEAEAAPVTTGTDDGEDLVAMPDGDFTAPPDPAMTGPAANGSRSRPSAGEPPDAEETPPTPGAKRKPWDRLRVPKDGKPRGGGKRVSLETWAARAWKGLAYVAGAGHTPTSRVLNMQAPVAGIVVDGMIRDTLPDKFLQPLARMGEGGKDVVALVGLPLLVFATERKPQLYAVTRPLMAEAATEWVLIAGPAMRKAKARAAAVARALAEFELDESAVDGMFDRPAENPAITAMLDAIFAPMMQPAAEAPAAAA